MPLKAAKAAASMYSHRYSPRPDACGFEKTLTQTLKQQWITTLIGDVRYESEDFHRLCRDELGIRNIFPSTARGRPRKDGKARKISDAIANR